MRQTPDREVQIKNKLVGVNFTQKKIKEINIVRTVSATNEANKMQMTKHSMTSHPLLNSS